jgi:HEAT repeat protein
MPTDHGEWTSRLPQVQPAPVRIERRLVDATPKGIARLLRAVRDTQEAPRCLAFQTLAGLIAERRRALESPLDYTAYAVDDQALERGLLAGLNDDSPLVRAHVLGALALLELDEKRIEVVAPLLADENWLVRLLAAELLAAGQGPVFEPVAKRLAAADPDPLVRRLAQCYLDAWASAPESR